MFATTAAVAPGVSTYAIAAWVSKLITLKKTPAQLPGW